MPEVGKGVAHTKHDIDVSGDVCADVGVPDLYSDLFPAIDGLIHLANRPAGNGLFFEGVEDLVDAFPELSLETPGCFIEVVFGGPFAKMHELVGHFVADDVSAVAEVLEAFHPDHPGHLDRFHKDVVPDVLGELEQRQGQQDYRRAEDGDQLQEPQERCQRTVHPLQQGRLAWDAEGLVRHSLHDLQILVVAGLRLQNPKVEIRADR